MYSVSIKPAPKPSRRREPPPAYYAQAIADGEEADRRIFRRSSVMGRPVGHPELQALLLRKGVKPPPGVPRPKLHTIMVVTPDSYSRETGVLRRALYSVPKKVWDHFAEQVHLGCPQSFCPDSCGRRGSWVVYYDTISADAPAGSGGLA